MQPVVAKDFAIFLEELRRQFLCCYPVQSIDWKRIPTNLTWEEQQLLIKYTHGHALNQQSPVKLAYQYNFLKRLMVELQKRYDDIHDAVYLSFCAVQENIPKDTTQKYCYKHYLLRGEETGITMRESKSFVADGTTGLCSWQASLALTDYLLHNTQLIQEKDVLEIGAGTGLCGLILLLASAAKRISLTDGSRECIDLMRENIIKNFVNAKEISTNSFQINEKILDISVLQWGNISEADLPAKLSPEILLAADVVYDDSVFTDLTQIIDDVFKLRQNNCMMLLAATVRNEHTLQKFLNLLDTLHFYVTEEDVIALEKSNLYWDRTTPVKIFQITRRNT